MIHRILGVYCPQNPHTRSPGGGGVRPGRTSSRSQIHALSWAAILLDRMKILFSREMVSGREGMILARVVDGEIR